MQEVKVLQSEIIKYENSKSSTSLKACLGKYQSYIRKLQLNFPHFPPQIVEIKKNLGSGHFYTKWHIHPETEIKKLPK